MPRLEQHIRDALADRYEILHEIGRGGMAQVFLAQDLRHARQVAIKVLNPVMAAAIGPGRFLREIEIAARLVHPHILALFDSGESNELLYYVMPYVPGQSLQDRLDREGPLPIDDAVRIGQEIASALDFAHRQGIVHRDIKPANILLHEDSALIADFGIALALQSADQERLTSTGHSMGTPAYMSPEQASGGQRVDARSDVFSLGTLLYEMLTGVQPFAGSTLQATIARILMDNPVRIRSLRPAVPAAVEAAIARAMAKTPADRFGSAADLGRALTASAVSRVPSAMLRRVGVAVLALGAAAAGLLALSRVLNSRTASRTAPRVERQLTTSGDAWVASLSPDGQKVAFLGEGRHAVMVMDLASGDTTVLARDTAEFNDWMGTMWSPDGSKVLYHGPHAAGYAYYESPAAGGTPRVVANNNAFLTYGADDSTFVGSYFASLYIGSQPTTFQLVGKDSMVGEGTVIDLRGNFNFIELSRASPDGRWIGMIAERPSGAHALATVSRDGRQRNILVPDLGHLTSEADDWHRPIQWSPAGDRIYFLKPGSGGWSIWQVDIDRTKGTARREPQLLVGQLPRFLSFGIGPDQRKLVYNAGTLDMQVHRLDLDGRGGVGAHLQLTTSSSTKAFPSLTPNGARIAYVRTEQDGRSDIFTVSPDGGQERRVTSTLHPKVGASVSPDGRRIAFVEKGDSGAGVYLADLDGGTPQRVGKAPASAAGSAPVWSPDGRSLLYHTPSHRNFMVLNLENGEEHPLIQNDSVGWIFRPTFAPDGERVVVFWHRPPRGDLWTIDLRDGTQTRLPETGGSGAPIGWGADGGVYFEGSGSKVDLIKRWDPRTRRSSVVARLQVRCTSPYTAISSDGGHVICVSQHETSDVWLSELPTR